MAFLTTLAYAVVYKSLWVHESMSSENTGKNKLPKQTYGNPELRDAGTESREKWSGSEEALDIVSQNLRTWNRISVFHDLSKLARTSTRFKDIFSRERNNVSALVRDNYDMEFVPDYWLRQMVQNDHMFDAVIGANPSNRLEIARWCLEYQPQRLWTQRVHRTILQILQEHGEDPMILFAWDFAKFRLIDTVDTVDTVRNGDKEKIEAWFDAMDAYHPNWLDTRFFKMYFPYERTLHPQNPVNPGITFFELLMSQGRISIFFLNLLAQRYDLTNTMQAPQWHPVFHWRGSPLQIALSGNCRIVFPHWVALLEFLLRWSDINDPVHQHPVFRILQQAWSISNTHKMDSILEILYQYCSNYDWKTLKLVKFRSHEANWINAWQYCRMLIDDSIEPSVLQFLNKMKTWLESLGARSLL